MELFDRIEDEDRRLINGADAVLAGANPLGAGLYLYPFSGHDLAPLLVLPDDNPSGSRLLRAGELLSGRLDPAVKAPVLPVLCDHANMQALFGQAAYPELWERFKTACAVRPVGDVRGFEAPFPAKLFVAALDRAGKRSEHPFVFVQANAHRIFPQKRWDWLAMVKCTFTGAPDEGSPALSRQVLDLPHGQRPAQVVCDRSAAADFRALRDGAYRETGQTWLDGWGWDRAFLFERVALPELSPVEAAILELAGRSKGFDLFLGDGPDGTGQWLRDVGILGDVRHVAPADRDGVKRAFERLRRTGRLAKAWGLSYNDRSKRFRFETFELR